MKHSFKSEGAVGYGATHQILRTKGLASIRRRPLITPILQSPLDRWKESLERKRVDPHRVDEVYMVRKG